VLDLVIRKRAWTHCVEELNPSMWASFHCMELLILHTMPATVHYMIKNTFTGTTQLTPGLKFVLKPQCTNKGLKQLRKSVSVKFIVKPINRTDINTVITV